MERKKKILLVVCLFLILIPISSGVLFSKKCAGIDRIVIRPPAFDFENLLGDIYWIRTTQTLGTLSLQSGGMDREDFALIGSMFDRLTDLRPGFIAAYQHGGLALGIQAPELAISLLEKGIRNNPNCSWKLPFYAGVISYKGLKDDRTTCRYLKVAMKSAGCPDYVNRFLARTTAKTGDLRTSLEMWKVIHDNATTAIDKNMSADGIVKIVEKILAESRSEALKNEAQILKESL